MSTTIPETPCSHIKDTKLDSKIDLQCALNWRLWKAPRAYGPNYRSQVSIKLGNVGSMSDLARPRIFLGKNGKS